MRKIFLSFAVIVAFALFATFSRRNIGVGADRFLTPNVSVLTPTTPQTQNTPISSGPTYIPKRVINYFSDDSEGEDDGRSRNTVQPTTPAPTPTTVPVTTPTVSTPKQTGQFKDGSYTGIVADAYYGNIQVKAVISGGKLTDVVFLQYPSDRRTSVQINTQAMPMLKSEAISIQSGNVDIVSGATDSSLAFRQSMTSALSLAKN